MQSLVQCLDSTPNLFGFLDTTIAPVLLYYAYFPIIIIALGIGGYVFVQRRKTSFALPHVLFFALAVVFSLYLLNETLQWIATPAPIVHFAWELIILFRVAMLVLLLCFVVTLITQRTLSAGEKWSLAAVTVPILLTLPTTLNVDNFDLVWCQPEIGYMHYYLYLLEACAVVFLVFRAFRALHGAQERKHKEVVLVTLVGAVSYILFFSLVDIYSEYTSVYEFNFYGPLGMTIFLGAMSYLMVRYQTFQVQMLGVTAIVGTLWALIGSLLFVARSETIQIVTGLTLIFAIVFGVLLIQSIRRETENRLKGERLARYLANANARLRELDKQKTEFISVASHQLRSPIAAIKGYAAMMMEGSYGKVPDKFEEPVERILQSGNRIAIMVDDFLNVTRIEQGRLTFNRQRIELCDLVRCAVDELRVMAKNKKIALTLETPPKAKYYIDADQSKISQVISNVVDNAIKYTPKGFVTVFVEPHEAQRTIVIRVQDSGIGIPQEEIPNLFQKLGRASNANDGTVNGTGLGLYIAREIVRGHNGWIHISSEGIGKGSTFTIELPLLLDEGGLVQSSEEGSARAA